MNKTKVIDEKLYSRQLYTFGFDAMRKITESEILISCKGNFTGLALELCKCVVLAGVKKVSINVGCDKLTWKDLASNYYVNESDIGKPFLDKILRQLRTLNDNVQIDTQEYMTDNNVKKYMTVVYCDYDIYDLIYWNRLCRTNNIKFISVQTHGLYGNVFCDFGDEYVINDLDGEQCRTGIITKIENSKLFTAEPSKLYTGDVIMIDGTVEGLDSHQKYLVKVEGWNLLLCKFEETYNGRSQHELQMMAFKSQHIQMKNQTLENVRFNQVKIPVKMKFKSLRDSLDDPEIVMFDTQYWNMPKLLHTFMKVLSLWRINNSNMSDKLAYPSIGNNEDYSFCLKHFKTQLVNIFRDIKFDVDIQTIFDKLYYTCQGRIVGVDAVIGSIGAQEVIKSITHKYTPNYQFLHFESLNILPDTYIQDVKNGKIKYDINSKTRYLGQLMIFGDEFMNEIKKQRVFIVGSGAIGCEHLKNFSMMGLNNIIITDMDHIENSNLNRQFLFRKTDIGKSKSVTASLKAKEMNPEMKIEAHQNKVCKDTLNIYNTEFFNKIDFVANALDNIEARLFMDTLCLKYDKPLFESGTLGTKGNVQSVIPNLTDSYGSIQDPPEQSIPVCTLKLFPYKYEHLTQYSRDLFEGYFNRVVTSINKAKDKASMNKLTPTDIKVIYDDIMMVTNSCKNFKYCIYQGYLEWHKIYRDTIRQLVKKYPKDHLDDEKNRFWSGDKIFPQEQKYDVNNKEHLEFVKSFAYLWADMLGIQRRYKYDDDKKYIKFINRLKEPKEVINKDIDQKEQSNNVLTISMSETDMINNITKRMEINKGYLDKTKQIEFEKDDDTNHHIDFMTSATNNRAINYHMEMKDKHTVKGIVGKIIPAIATTTSIVSGLVSLEIYKSIYGKMISEYNRLDRYRYGSFNLAGQNFGFSEPAPAPTTIIDGKPNTIWTKHNIDSNTNVNEFVKSIEMRKNQENEIKLDFLTCENKIIYSHMDNDRMCDDMKLKDIIPNYDEKTTRLIEANYSVITDDDDDSDTLNTLNTKNISIIYRVM